MSALSPVLASTSRPIFPSVNLIFPFKNPNLLLEMGCGANSRHLKSRDPSSDDDELAQCSGETRIRRKSDN
jgi:hypothetical protein